MRRLRLTRRAWVLVLILAVLAVAAAWRMQAKAQERNPERETALGAARIEW